MSTANVARDLDLLKQAVGDPKLNYIGYSYGSYIGLTYANLFPDNFRALVVDGVVDPIAWATGYGNEGSTLQISTRLRSEMGAQATLNEFFRLCDAGGARCPLAPFGSIAISGKAAFVNVAGHLPQWLQSSPKLREIHLSLQIGKELREVFPHSC
jgi:pimeloyl-ACP methyl ester carboxylesterase